MPLPGCKKRNHLSRAEAEGTTRRMNIQTKVERVRCNAHDLATTTDFMTQRMSQILEFYTVSTFYPQAVDAMIEKSVTSSICSGGLLYVWSPIRGLDGQRDHRSPPAQPRMSPYP